MNYALKKIIKSGQEAIIKRYGDIVWEELCDTCNEPFRIKGMVGQLPSIRHLATRTQIDIMRCVLRNVMEDARNRSIDYKIILVQRTGPFWHI